MLYNAFGKSHDHELYQDYNSTCSLDIIDKAEQAKQQLGTSWESSFNEQVDVLPAPQSYAGL